MNLLKYTNGTGHLIMSIVATAAGLALILVPGMDAATKGVGVGLITTVQGYWFVSGSAKQIASEVIGQMNQQNVSSSTSPVLTVTQPPPILTVSQPHPPPASG